MFEKKNVTSWNGNRIVITCESVKPDLFFSIGFISFYTINTFKREREREREGERANLESCTGVVVVYYESRKRELQIRLMNEGRCDERLKVKDRVEESTCLTYTGLYDKTYRLLFIMN